MAHMVLSVYVYGGTHHRPPNITDLNMATVEEGGLIGKQSHVVAAKDAKYLSQ